MIKTSYEVINIEDNQLFDKKTLLEKMGPALLVNFLHPAIAFNYIKNYLKLDVKDNVEIKEYNDERIESLIVSDLCHTAETLLKKEDDSGVLIADLIKNVIENKILAKLNKSEDVSTIMSVDDLMSKLYVLEEKGSKTR